MKKNSIVIAIIGVVAAFVAACWAFPKIYFGKIRKYTQADMSGYN